MILDKGSVFHLNSHIFNLICQRFVFINLIKNNTDIEKHSYDCYSDKSSHNQHESKVKSDFNRIW